MPLRAAPGAPPPPSLVEPDLTIPGHPEVFVIGDLAALTIGGESVPGVAPAAIQEGKHAAANIKWRLAGKPTRPFRYVDKGMLATIGRAAAVGTLGKVKLSGFLAWATWAFVHLVYLVGFRSRILVFIEWAWSYFTYQRGARLITGPIDRHILGPSAGSLRQLVAPPRRQNPRLPSPSSVIEQDLAALEALVDEDAADLADHRAHAAEVSDGFRRVDPRRRDSVLHAAGQAIPRLGRA